MVFDEALQRSISLFTFPRKGTETCCCGTYALALLDHYLHSPVRGRKLPGQRKRHKLVALIITYISP